MNIELFEGQSCLVHVKLPEEWKVYGGTPNGEFRSERESADSVLVTVPAMEAEFTPLVPYELFARRILDGKEWLVLSGQLHVRRRYSDAGGGVSAIEYFVEPQLVEDGISSSPKLIVGIPGPQGPKGDKGDPGTGGMTAEERATLAGAAQREGDNTFTAANTFTGSVDMSTAQVTPPEGWNVGELTAEQVQAVAPIAWFDSGKAEATSYSSSAFGVNSYASANATALGYGAESYTNAIALGYNAKTLNGTYHEIVIGQEATANNHCNITVGSNFGENVNGSITWHKTRTEGTGSITIGAGANTLNNGTTESSNSVTIGCKAENKGADSVVIGAQASTSAAGSVVVGTGARANMSRQIAIGANAMSIGFSSLAIGAGAASSYNSVVIGESASSVEAQQVSIGVGTSGGVGVAVGCYAANNLGGTAIGYGATAATCGTAIGNGAKSANTGAVVFLSRNAYYDDATLVKTQLYFSGANTPLANEYYNGEALMGYTVTDASNNVLACGTRRLSELFPDNSLTQPASLDENGEWVQPKVFHPSDLDLPTEEPSEPEEYTPLPVYPIVEPDDIMGDNGTLEQGDTENTSPATNS